MTRILLALFVAVAISGCTTVDTTEPFVIAPSAEDWRAAFARLSPAEQATFKESGGVALDMAGALDENVYSFGYGPPNGNPIRNVRLNLRATVRT